MRRSTRTSRSTRRRPACSSCATPSPALSPRLRRRDQARGSHHHRRRQAGALQHRDGAVRAGRRSDHARPVLAEHRRSDQARRRQAGDRADAHGRRLRDQGRADHRCDHAAHQGDHRQLAVQSDRRADHRSRNGGDRRRGRGARHLGHRRLHLREADLRAGPAQPDQGAVRSDARQDRDLQRRLEGLRDDRLALRLGDRPEGNDRAVQRRPGPLDLEHQLDHAEGRRSPR